jgi:leader peptidase (prepilin peptidase) / N-methyltransferase
MITLQENQLIFALLCGTFGIAIGSFLNVVIYRLPIMLKNAWEQECRQYLKQIAPPFHEKIFNLFLPRSHCPNCKALIPFWANIPIISFFALKGKCYKCAANIAWRYPSVELLTGIASFLVAYHFGVTLQAAALLILTWGLITITLIDLEHMLIPDDISLALLWLGLLLNASTNLFTHAEYAIFGAMAAYASLWLIAYIFKLIRKIEGMGHGDFKLFAIFGAWFGVKMLLPIILIAALTGSIVAIAAILCKKHHFQKPLPFGPFLAFAGWLTIFFGDKLLAWYQSLL